MTKLKLKHFETSQSAMERSIWKGRQSRRLYETAQQTIQQSRRVMEEARSLKSLHEAVEQ